MTAHEPEPVPNFDAAAGPAPVAGPAGPEPVDAGAVLFPAESLRAATLPDQADAIASTLGYKNSIKQEGAQPVGEFGVTRPVYAFEPPGPHADQAAGTFTVTGTVVAQITYQITTTSGRTDIASDADPDITQQNYRTVASDLTPSPTTTTVTPGGAVALYKGQPPRTRFWAADLTVNHELVHAGEDVTFGQEGVTIAQNWFNRQTAATYDDVGALLNRVTPMVVRHVDAKMALPGRELRAYDRGAADYRARAQAIKRKGDANGYAPPAPAPRAPNAPSPPARKEPAPG
ncbi:MAG: hypothetical protein K2X87_28135 [Gemmataceae bacterium]|nr:hypothetical protein [Gemmataceae bacterium]